ncbi:MAG: hypothetical protein U5Q44_01270 [Dehalococcoidia bacterium]|nr:hypothetical protein [Dehalococcoidia bacterium]
MSASAPSSHTLMRWRTTGGREVAVRETLGSYYDTGAIVGLTLLVGFYVMTAEFAAALDVEPEERFIGWQLY